MRQHQPVSRPALCQASSAMDVLAPCAPPVPPMPPIPQPPAEFLHGWKRHSMGKPVTDRQLFWEFCFKRNVATATSVAPTRAFGRSGFSCTSKSAGQRNRGQPRTSVAKTRKIVLHSGSVDCNRHLDTTKSADCGQIFGSVLGWPKGKTWRMDAGLVGQATACSKCILQPAPNASESVYRPPFSNCLVKKFSNNGMLCVSLVMLISSRKYRLEFDL